MQVEIRIYRRHDADLMMLKSYSVNVPKMMKEVLNNYVEGKKIKYSLPGSQECPIDNLSMLRYRLTVTNLDVIALLKRLKHGYRNQFCKMLLRDALVDEPLGVYFSKPEDIRKEHARIFQAENIQSAPIGKLYKKETEKELQDKYLKRAGKKQAGSAPKSSDSVAQTASAVPNTTDDHQQDILPGKNQNETVSQNRSSNVSVEPVKEERVASAATTPTTDEQFIDPHDQMELLLDDEGYTDDPFGAFNPVSKEEQDEIKKKKSNQMLNMFNDMLGGL